MTKDEADKLAETKNGERERGSFLKYYAEVWEIDTVPTYVVVEYVLGEDYSHLPTCKLWGLK